MSTFTNTTTLLHAHINKLRPHHHPKTTPIPLTIRAALQGEENATCRRRVVTTLLATSLAFGVLNPVTTPIALAQNWGTKSFLKERFFEPGLSPEDAVARIKQTAEGLHSIREMLESMAWRYVLFYIRLKSSYLSQDLKNAMTTLPESRRKDYVKAANELVDNMAEVLI